DASQVITESHSAIALPGTDKDKLLESLRSRFVNVSSAGAVCEEISIGKMIEEAATQKSEPSSNDVLSLTEAYCFKSFKSERDTSLLGRILACRNSDGGFGWFEGMRSSQSVTATVLDRMALVRSLGGNIPDLTSSVEYLDSTQFLGFPRWFGGLSNDTYMLVRSNFPSVWFKVRMDKSQRKEYRSRLSSFRKYARIYLSPSNRFDFIDGQPGAKARRVRTLSNLIGSEEGISLARAWGERFNVDAALRRSMDEDILSILEYAVRHDGGGFYYPNAVMPFRGLLENEAYAHSLISDVLSEYASSHSDQVTGQKAAEIADGVRLWLILQKETQNWDTDPAFVNALCSVGKGSTDLLNTSVVTLTQRVLKPLADVKASGNGFSLEKRYFIGDKEVGQGDTVRRGDRIRAVYTVQNSENRSFIRLTAPREASLIPVDQLSGIYNLSFTPLTVDGWYRVYPCGYRDVKPDRTVFYFDTYPEGHTTVTEDFFVTQTGTFQAPVPEIESLYAPHYRANAAAVPRNLEVK
uniref:alpha-2-macroglobulin family protein n=1 Tax=Candidatus Cryptobacteroides bacterium TaxID=3085639 RepID=UPI00402A1DA3